MMPGLLLHVGATAICPHGGQISIIPSNLLAQVGGQPVATLADTYIVAGCPFLIGNTPHPCLTVKWLTPSIRIQANGQPVILQTSTGLCQSADQTPQGPPAVIVTQIRVSGS